MSAKRESGLSRWARRKAAAQGAPGAGTAKRGAALPTAAVQADAVPDAPQSQTATAAATDHTDDAAIHQDAAVPADLPDIESLDYDSDYAGFLSKDISDAVRNIALRKLWRSNPLLANVDGLVDYDDDFSDAATVIEGMKSAYRVGRGMIEDEPDGAEEALASAAGDAEAPQDAEHGAVDPSAATEDATLAQQEPETQTAVEETAQDAVAENADGEKSGGVT